MKAVALLFALVLGPWSVSIDQTEQWTIKNTDQNVTLQGTFTFIPEAGQDASPSPWKITPARDGVKNRLALIDPKNDEVQGYLTFQQDGNRLEVLVLHRTRQFYHGTLTFDGTLEFRRGAFTCRTKAAVGEQPLLLKTGVVDSPLDDSVFDPESDLLMHFDAANLKLTTLTDTAAEGTNQAGGQAGQANQPTANGKFHVTFSGRIQEAAEARFTFELKPHYYRDRYVPYYAPINRKRCPKAPTGWMSWNLYFDKATAEDNLAEARMGKKLLQPFGLEFWSIESWQGNSDQLPVSKFYNLNLETNESQFPEGMKKLADDIRALGFRPGLWIAPFGTGNEAFYKAHKSWFLHDKDGKPMATWNGRYTIDPTHEGLRAHVQRICDIASHQWGYEFFKIDGMSGSNGGYCAHFFEHPNVKAAFRYPGVKNPFELYVQTLRRGIGEDRVFLACQGHYTGPEAKYADAARIGADIVHPNQPVKWANLLNQADRTVNQIFTHNVVFYSDPDTLLVNEALTLEEARVSTTVVSLPGQVMFSGDKLATLPAERVKLLQQTLPVCDVRPARLYPIFERPSVWDLKVQREWGSYDVVALFNWSDSEAEVACDFREIGLDPQTEYVVYEFWTARFCGIAKDAYRMKVPPHAVRLLAVHKYLPNQPQFLSSDRHVTQGAVDVRKVSWNAESRELTVRVELVGANSTTLRFLIPDGMAFRQAATDAETDCVTKLEADGKVLAVTLTNANSKEVECSLAF